MRFIEARWEGNLCVLVLPGALVWVVAARSTALPSRFYAFYTNLHVHVKLLEGIGWRAGQKDTAGAPGGGVHTATTPPAFHDKNGVPLGAQARGHHTQSAPPPHQFAQQKHGDRFNVEWWWMGIVQPLSCAALKSTRNWQ